MRIHELSRGSKTALIALLSLAVILPLLALLPRYIAWEQKRATQQSYTANASDSF